MQIDLKSDRPIYEQIYEYFKDAILEGRFKKGEKLPSKRILARDISVAVNTVTSAYEMLRSLVGSEMCIRDSHNSSIISIKEEEYYE